MRETKAQTARHIRETVRTRSRHVIYLPFQEERLNRSRIMDARTRKGRLEVRLLSTGQWIEVQSLDRLEYI